MACFIIKGQRQLTGTFQPAGNKNAALPMLAACLLTDEPVELKNVPLINDVFTMVKILSDLGVSIRVRGNNVRLHARTVRKRRLNRQLCHEVRSSILFAGAMLARHKRVTLYAPGGDVIGHRRLNTHFLALKALGVEISEEYNSYGFRTKQLHGADILLDQASVTATENIMLASSLAPGRTMLFNAACEPHVQDLGQLLNKMGARISGLGTNSITIQGVKSLHGASHFVCPDHIEIGSLIVAAAVTGGKLTIKGVSPIFLNPIMQQFKTLGIPIKVKGDMIHIVIRKRMQVENNFGRAVPVIDDGPWPNFPSDLMSVLIVAATQAKGTVLFFEKMFESRMYFVDNLINMGANIVQCDPHRILVVGPSELKNIHVSSPDIRAGMAMLIAALCAKGTSIIDNAQVIDRGYQRIEQRLQNLGADITRKLS